MANLKNYSREGIPTEIRMITILKNNGIHMIVASIIGVSALAGVAHSDGARSTCSLASLKGTYAWSTSTLNSSSPESSSGMESYDGAGHMKYYEYSSNGTTQYTAAGTATYSITANCIATVT